MAMNEREIALVVSAQGGDSNAFEELYNHYYGKIFALARVTVKNEADSEDILQQTFINAWRNLSKLVNPAGFNTWLQKITLNQCYSLLRNKNIAILRDAESEIEDISEDVSDELLPAVYAERDDLRVRLGKIIDGLSEVQKQTIVLFYFNEQKVEEIADIMDCSTGTVKTRLLLARKAIRSEVEEEERKSGEKFYGIVGIPMLPLGEMLAQQIQSQMLTAEVSSSVLAAVTEALSLSQAASGSTTVAATSAAASSAATAGSATSGIVLSTKIIAIACTLAVGVGSVFLGMQLFGNGDSPEPEIEYIYPRRGIVIENTYISEYMGISIDLPPGFEYAPDWIIHNPVEFNYLEEIPASYWEEHNEFCDFMARLNRSTPGVASMQVVFRHSGRSDDSVFFDSLENIYDSIEISGLTWYIQDDVVETQGYMTTVRRLYNISGGFERMISAPLTDNFDLISWISPVTNEQLIAIQTLEPDKAMQPHTPKPEPEPEPTGEPVARSHYLEVDLSFRDLTDDQLASMIESGDIPYNVTFLWLAGNKISNYTVLSELSYLTGLDLGVIENSDISSLAELTNLTSLSLHGDAISDITPLARLTSLEFLQIPHSDINDISSLAGLINLEYLILYSNKISDITPLAGLTNLTHLNLNYTQTKDITPLQSLTNLTFLDLSNNEINDITPLRLLVNLTELLLIDNPLSEAQIAELRALLPDCHIKDSW